MDFEHFLREANTKPDYNTNAGSYYKDLARKQELIKLLAKKIWDYEKLLDETLENLSLRLESYISENDSLMTERLKNWDERIENLDEEVSHIFVEWLNDGTLEQIINHDVLGNKADKTYVDDVIGITPLSFGAIGDGITDDGLAIKATHVYANEHNLKVVYPYGYTFYVSEVSEIPIKTNVDFSGSKIVIEDNPKTVSNTLPVFNIPDENSVTHENNGVTIELSSLIKKNFVGQIPLLATGEYKFVQIYDEDELILPRVTPIGNPEPRYDMFRVDPDGYILDPIMYDFTKVTKAVVHNIPEKLTLKFGKVESTGNPTSPESSSPVYMWRNFLIERSNVDIIGLDHEDIVDSITKQQSRGIIYTRDCCEIRIKDTKLIPSKRNGTYRMSSQRTLDILLDHVEGDTLKADRHSVFTAYTVKGLHVNNSRLNVVSTHNPSSTITVENTTLGQGGIITAGFGDLILKDVTFKSRVPIQIRGDYGGFWDGNIRAENITHHIIDSTPTYPARFMQVDANQLKTDFGVDIMFGRENISIKNLEIKDSGASLSEYAMIQIQTGSASEITDVHHKYKISPIFEFDAIRRTSGLGIVPFWINGFANLEAKTVGSSTTDVNGNPTVIPNVRVLMSDCKLDVKNKFYGGDTQRVSNLISPLPSEVYGYSATENAPARSLVFHFILNRCDDVFASIKGLAGIIEARDCVIRTHMNSLVGGSRSITTLMNCVIEPYFDKSSSFKPIIRGDFKRNTFINCTFKRPINQDGVVSPSSQSVLDVYEIFTNVVHNSNIKLLAKLIGCSYSEGLNLGVFNENLLAFTQDFGTATSEYWLRNIGEIERRPTNGLYVGFSYFSTTDNVRSTWNGVSWV